MEGKKENKIEIIEEPNESEQIEETINDMLSKVMEENNKTNSLDFDDDEMEEDSFKISRESTRHQTTAKPTLLSNSNNIVQSFNVPNFDRNNKRNLTVNNYNQASNPSFNNSFFNTNMPLINNKSLFYANNANNKFAPNFYNNALQNINNNNNFGFNNNLNQSFQSYHSFNPQYSNNYLNTSMDPNNFIRNSIPYSKTVVYHNQRNIFNLGNNIFHPNNNLYKYGNNIPISFNNNNAGYIPMNLDMDFKRGENRKKTYDTTFNFQNNIISGLNNNNINNNVCYNKQIEEYIINPNSICSIRFNFLILCIKINSKRHSYSYLDILVIYIKFFTQ